MVYLCERSCSVSIAPVFQWFQMWFDANGRAYVSLATRYDPVRK